MGRAPTGDLLFADAFASPAAFAVYADVAVNRPVRCEFTYGVPDELVALAKPGSRAVVHLGGRREVGVVTGLRKEPSVDAGRIKPLLRVLDGEPILDASLL